MSTMPQCASAEVPARLSPSAQPFVSDALCETRFPRARLGPGRRCRCGRPAARCGNDRPRSDADRNSARPRRHHHRPRPDRRNRQRAGRLRPHLRHRRQPGVHRHPAVRRDVGRRDGLLRRVRPRDHHRHERHRDVQLPGLLRHRVLRLPEPGRAAWVRGGALRRAQELLVGPVERPAVRGLVQGQRELCHGVQSDRL
ncbi:hypothetical protein DFJ74DRAFT_662809, partial [Hyaloraphidium curvatum]